MTTIAVDAMGGDFAPENTVQGAVQAVSHPDCDFEVLLVGDERRIRESAGGSLPPRIRIEHAGGTIAMDEGAATALRKKDSPIVRGLELQRDGSVQGFISAGNTGVVMAASTLILGRIERVSRPTIGTFIPTHKGVTLLLDAGANVDCKPLNLYQFALMGSVYTQIILGIDKPLVGLVNVGEEDAKGNDVAVETNKMLRQAPIAYVGNIEGRDILNGKVDVAVCDGFVGNIILKFAESVPGFLKSSLMQYASQGLFQKLWIGLIAGTLRKLMKRWDYQEYGGVPLLGVNGVSIIGHGRSTPKAIKNMILRAREMIEKRVNDRIRQAMLSMPQAGENGSPSQ